MYGTELPAFVGFLGHFFVANILLLALEMPYNPNFS